MQAKLERGAQVADVGCGRGRALIKLAQAFPRSRYVGYGVFGSTIEPTTANARAAEVTDRVHFAQRDVSKGLPEHYDVITTTLSQVGREDTVSILLCAVRDAGDDDV